MQGSLMLDIAGCWLTAEDRNILRQPEVGGLILFARNIEHPQQVIELCRSIRKVRPDLLIAVDQEGGASSVCVVVLPAYHPCMQLLPVPTL